MILSSKIIRTSHGSAVKEMVGYLVSDIKDMATTIVFDLTETELAVEKISPVKGSPEQPLPSDRYKESFQST